MQLNEEQNELEAHEQQLLNTVEDDDEDEDEQTRQNLSAQLRCSAQGQGSPTKSPELTGPTNEQLKAELECMRLQQELDRQALKEANQHLAEEENARQGEAEREFIIGT